MNQRRLFVIALSLGMLFSVSVFAGSKKKPTPPPQAPPTTITSVTANSVTISEAKVAKSLAITQFTEINVNGRRATAAELKPGMTVTVTLGGDPSSASRINATGK
jgi:hypothetical protein